jgi:hypothetical protein
MVFLIIAGRETVDKQKNLTDILDKKLFRRREIFRYIKGQYTGHDIDKIQILDSRLLV